MYCLRENYFTIYTVYKVNCVLFLQALRDDVLVTSRFQDGAREKELDIIPSGRVNFRIVLLRCENGCNLSRCYITIIIKQKQGDKLYTRLP